MSFFQAHKGITFILIGTVLMAVLMMIQRRLYRLRVWQALLFTVLLTAVGVAGVRLLAILEGWRNLLAGNLPGGMSLFGAIFLIPILMPFVGFMFRLRAGQTLDLCAPCVAGMFGVMRINCWITGCCGGRVVHYMGRDFVPPVQLIDGGWNFYLMIVLMIFNMKRQKEGIAYAMLMTGYSVMRFIIEFYRDTEKTWFHMSHGQVFSLFCIVIGLIFIIRSGYRFDRPMLDPAEGNA